jgi:hypothetical protein
MRSEEVQAKLSASKMEAASLCPAYWSANITFAWQGDRDSANEGTIRHEHEENQTPLEEIEDDERRLCAYRCRIALEECRQKVFGDKEGEIKREERLWYDESWSGQLDYSEAFGVDVLIADYKKLHGSHTPAPDNIQLIAQAVLYWKNYPHVETIYAALIEPFNDPWYTSVKYSVEFLKEKARWLEEVVAKSYKKDPEKVFGHKQCKWCSALYVCPEAKSHLFSCIQKKEK